MNCFIKKLNNFYILQLDTVQLLWLTLLLLGSRQRSLVLSTKRHCHNNSGR